MLVRFIINSKKNYKFMEKNYYFVIGQKNLDVVEAIKLLEAYHLPYRCLESPYIFTKTEEDALKQQGYEPYYVHVTYRSFPDGEEKFDSSFLYRLIGLLGKTFSDWQYDVMTYCEKPFAKEWSNRLRGFVIRGCSRAYIEKLQAENRKALGFNDKAEETAIQAVDEAMKRFSSNRDCLIVHWDYKPESSEFESFLPVLDRVFWLQNFVNVLIVTPECALYYGYRNIACDMVTLGTATACVTDNMTDFLYSIAHHRMDEAERFMQTKTAELRNAGLLW